MSNIDWLSRHIKEVFLAVILACMAWAIALLLQMREYQIRESGKLDAVIERVNANSQSITKIIATRYSNKDAEKDQRINELERDKMKLQMELKK